MPQKKKIYKWPINTFFKSCSTSVGSLQENVNKKHNEILLQQTDMMKKMPSMS